VTDVADASAGGAPEERALLEKDLVFLDCEMTGGDPEKNDVIEIGAVRSRLPSLEIVDQLSVKVAPRTTRGTNQNSLRIAGYSAKEWKSAIPIDEALRRLQELSADSVLVGWATYNDLLFILAAATRAGIDGLVGDAYVELQDWAQDRLRLPRTPGLQRVADQLKIVRDQEHSAIEDALVTYEVFRILWRYSPAEFDDAVPSLDWNSYAELSGPIKLGPAEVDARREELARFVVHGTSRDVLLARRGSFRR
jgi:DNA polymerase III alpha subunit (gram-positive type)